MLFFFSFLYRFTPVELAFLAEYAKTMSPVAKALDVLQGETSVQMGWLVPTITTKDQAPAPSCQVKSNQVTFIYIALLTIQIVSKHLTVSSWRIECQ